VEIEVEETRLQKMSVSCRSDF